MKSLTELMREHAHELRSGWTFVDYEKLLGIEVTIINHEDWIPGGTAFTFSILNGESTWNTLNHSA